MQLEDILPDDPRLLSDVLPVLRELRPHLGGSDLARIYSDGFVEGLRFLAAYDGASCVGVAGWRMVHNTVAGRHLYVDDLVTKQDRRSGGVGRLLLSELERRARTAGSTTLELDSGVQRERAHRFYFREGMSISSFHFRRVL